VLSGAGGTDYVVGDDGDDILSGGIGNDLLEGGAGKDRFIFRPGYGSDYVADFATEDIVDLTGLGAVRTLAALLLRATQVDNDTVIDFGNGDILTLQNTSRASLVDDDFQFYQAPMASAPDFSATRGQVISAASLFSVSGGDGDALSYWFRDNTVGGGHFEYDGSPKAEGQTFGVSQSQLSHLTFRAGASGSDNITFNVWDGQASSSVIDFHIFV
jgi:hypothetical protein